MRVTKRIGNAALLTLVVACSVASREGDVATQSEALTPKAQSPRLATPAPLVYDTDVAVGGYIGGNTKSANISVFDTPSGPGFARRINGNAPTTGFMAAAWPPPVGPLSDSASSGSTFSKFNHIPKIAWVQREPMGNGARPVFASVVTIDSTVNPEVDVALAITKDGGQTWVQVTNVTVGNNGFGTTGCNGVCKVVNTAIAVDPYYVIPQTRQFYVVAQALASVNGQLYGNIIHKYHLDNSDNLVDDGVINGPPLDAVVDEPRTMTMTAN